MTTGLCGIFSADGHMGVALGMWVEIDFIFKTLPCLESTLDCVHPQKLKDLYQCCELNLQMDCEPVCIDQPSSTKRSVVQGKESDTLRKRISLWTSEL